jgi:hypothetical protein
MGSDLTAQTPGQTKPPPSIAVTARIFRLGRAKRGEICLPTPGDFCRLGRDWLINPLLITDLIELFRIKPLA